VLSAMTTMFGEAMPCSRAARFGVLLTVARGAVRLPPAEQQSGDRPL
jgi:hypothetical protein